MSVVILPCDYEEWWEYKRLFILVSHLRSILDLKLLISSHTREDISPSPISRCLGALKGLLAYLFDYCNQDEQEKFLTKTLPFIARSAALLEERIPLSGIPYLEKQENSALVLGRKVVLSLLANAFLCTFSAFGSTSFSFERVFASLLDKDEAKRHVGVTKLRSFLCYFERAASDRCNLSGVITFRRQVLRSDMPQISEWESNSNLLCPFEVDDEHMIEDSGGHTLQVCLTLEDFQGGLLSGGSSQEELRFFTCPELNIAQLIMDSMDDNEALVVTGTEKFAEYSSCGEKLSFSGEYFDESERDVFGHFLNSLVALDVQPVPPDQPHTQYQPPAVLRELNKAYVGMHCQQDRGDISTELLALSVRRGSLALVMEDYPECGSPLNVVSRQSDLGNVHISSNTGVVAAAPDPHHFKAVSPLMESTKSAPPLSPIPEMAEAMHFSKPEAVSEKRGGELDEFVSNFAGSLLLSACSEASTTDESMPSAAGTSSLDDLASSLSSSILKVVSVEDEMEEQEKKQQQQVQQEKQEPPSLSAPSAGESEKRCASLAQSIISDVLSSCQAPPTEEKLPQTLPPPLPPSAADVEGKSASLAHSIISEVLSSQQEGKSSTPVLQPTVSAVPPATDVATSLASSVVSGALSSSNPPPPDIEEKSSILVQSIISEVLSSARQPQAPPLTTVITPQTTGEPTSSNSIAKQLGDSIISDAIQDYATSFLPPPGPQEPLNLAAPQNAPAIFIQVERRGSVESGRSSRSSSLTGQGLTVHEYVSEIMDEAIREGLAVAQFTAQGQQAKLSPESDGSKKQEVNDGLDVSGLVEVLIQDTIQDGVQLLEQAQSSSSSTEHSPQVPRKQPPSLVRQGLTLGAVATAWGQNSSSNRNPEDLETPSSSNQLSSRLLTPSSSRTGYAWSIASTRDEDSRPVSPTDLDKLGLSLSSTTEEFSSLFSSIIINHAISNVAGEALSPGNIDKEPQDYISFSASSSTSSSSKIGLYLSKLSEAEPPELPEVAAPPPPPAQQQTCWQSMRRQLLRPIATGYQGRSAHTGNDPLLQALIQWMAASASNRPRLFYYTSKEGKMKQLAGVTAQLRAKNWTVGQLCCSIIAFGKRHGHTDLSTFLLNQSNF